MSTKQPTCAVVSFFKTAFSIFAFFTRLYSHVPNFISDDRYIGLMVTVEGTDKLFNVPVQRYVVG